MTALPRMAMSRCRQLRQRKIDLRGTAGRRRISGAGERRARSDMDRRGANAACVAAPHVTSSASPSCQRARYADGSGKSWSDRDRKDPWSLGPRHNRSTRRRSKPTPITRRSTGASVRASRHILVRIEREGPATSSNRRGANAHNRSTATLDCRSQAISAPCAGSTAS